MDAASLHVGRLHRAEALRQQPVGHLPLARGDEHLGAAGIAEPQHGDVVVRGNPALNRGAPLFDALPVGRQLAGRDPDADDVADRLQAPNLSAGRGGECLVHLGHADLDRAGRNVGVPVPDQRGGLEVGVTEAPSHLERRLGEAAHVLRRGGSLGAGERKPSLFGHLAGVAEQPLRSREPPAAHGVEAVRGTELPGEPERAGRGATGIRLFSIGRVRAFHL